MKRAARVFLALWVAFCIGMPTVHAQTELGTVFKKKYRLRSVQCVACHVKSDKSEEDEAKEEAEGHKKPLNAFGTTLQKLVEGKKISERLNAAKKLEREEKDKVVKEIGAEFQKALEQLDGMKAPSGKTYKEVIAAGEIEGTKTRN